MNWTALIRQAFDRLALYLPAMVMSLFALGSWWLVRSVPELADSSNPKSARKEPDYYLHNFSVKSFNPQGQLVRELQAAHARHLPEFDVLEMERVEIQSIDDQGQRVVARADRARTQSENSHQEALTTLSGNANVVRMNLKDGVRTELRSEQLLAYEKGDRVVSETPVEMRRGEDVFTGETMNLNGQSGVYELQGRVRGKLMPTHGAKR